jgi:hypothetical protein
MGRFEEEIIGLVAGFFAGKKADELSGLSGGCTAGARKTWARKQAEHAWAVYAS